MKLGNDRHDVSIEYFADPTWTSFTKEPDIFVNHAATVEYPEPKSQAGKILHLLRAMRKIYHQCGAMLIELKPGPSRLPFNELEDKKLYASSVIRRAQNELFQYCSGYFPCYPDAKSVIAIGTGVHFGLGWTQWAFLNSQVELHRRPCK